MQNNRRRQISFLKKLEGLLRILPGKNRCVSLLVLIAVPVFVLYVGFRILGAREATAQIDAQSAKLERQIEQLDAQNQGYLSVLENDDPEVFRDYVIRTARERLDLSLPGDLIFKNRALYQSSNP